MAIETPRELKDDAIARGYKPEAVVRTITGQEVQITSWPWFEGEGDDQTALIMARQQVGDCRTNVAMRYFTIMQFVRTQPLEEAGPWT